MTASLRTSIKMATTFSLVVFGAILALLAPHAVKSCDIAPQDWCQTRDTAIECGVLEKCLMNGWQWQEAAPKVEFVVYYESLCPDCQRFIVGTLFPNYANLSSIMNLTLVPYGNARETKDGDKWVFECQHGPLECKGNVIDTCTIAIVKDINTYFPFINCMEMSRIRPVEAAKKCAAKYPVPLEEILKCSESDYGNKLEHEMAVMTDALSPQHQYVPWVTVDGVHTESIEKEAESNLVKLICESYKGPKPPVCQ